MRGLYSEGLIYGGKFAFHNCLSEPYSWKEIYRFCFFYLVFEGTFPSTSPIKRGDLTDGSLHYKFGGPIFGGAHAWRGLFLEFYGNMILTVFFQDPG